MKAAKWIILGAIIIFQAGILKSQVEIKKFGLGLHIERLKWKDDIFSDKVNKIIFIYSPTRHFRIEPEFGFISGKYNNLHSSIYCFGLAVLGKLQWNKVNFYSGMKISYSQIFVKLHDYNGKKQISLGPVLGLEYLINENFSIGGEFWIRKTSEITDVDPTYNIKLAYASTQFETGYFFRFYF